MVICMIKQWHVVGGGGPPLPWVCGSVRHKLHPWVPRQHVSFYLFHFVHVLRIWTKQNRTTKERKKQNGNQHSGSSFTVSWLTEEKLQFTKPLRCQPVSFKPFSPEINLYFSLLLWRPRFREAKHTFKGAQAVWADLVSNPDSAHTDAFPGRFTSNVLKIQ